MLQAAYSGLEELRNGDRVGGELGHPLFRPDKVVKYFYLYRKRQ
jgi:hypothetical protein